MRLVTLQLLTRDSGLPTMLSYEVTLDIEPALAAAVEDHMRRQHIPAIFATGCFRRVRFSSASPTRFRTSYEADSAADLERYLHAHASGFRAQFQALFPAGVTAKRETWIEQERWGGAASQETGSALS